MCSATLGRRTTKVQTSGWIQESSSSLRSGLADPSRDRDGAALPQLNPLEDRGVRLLGMSGPFRTLVRPTIKLPVAPSGALGLSD